MSDVAVDIRGLVRRFGNVVAVDHLDLVVHRGEFLSLLGPSGCGKTTTLRMVGGLDQPTAGQIMIGGRDVTDVPPDRRPTSIVFQDYALFPHRTVRENVEFGLKMRGEPAAERRAKALAMLATVGLEGMADRKPSQLSGGQRQRVALARSLVVEPEVLLLDEPLGALDAMIRRQMQGELRRLQRSLGLTFLYVTHDQEEAMAMSDRLVVMRGGRIAQEGAPEEVYRRPRSAFVAGFLGECNLIPVRLGRETPSGWEVEGPFRGLPVVAGPAPAGLGPGDPAEIAVRPEQVRLGAAGKGVLDAIVAERSYLGSETRLVLDAAGWHLIARVDDAAWPVPGDTVSLAWETASLVVPDGTSE